MANVSYPSEATSLIGRLVKLCVNVLVIGSSIQTESSRQIYESASLIFFILTLINAMQSNGTLWHLTGMTGMASDSKSSSKAAQPLQRVGCHGVPLLSS